MTPAIQTRGLTKRFGSFTALDGLDLTVEPGQVHGFLGPNGAGKSTTIRVLLGMLRADGGTAEVLGGDPWHDAVALHRRMAYVPGDVALWPNLSGGEALDILGRLHGSGSAKRRSELIDAFDLDPRKKCRTYSKGNRQKVAIIAALASDAELVLLDEPTSGLDPLMEATFDTVVDQLRDEGRTFLLSSHILAQVEKLADQISIIRQGVIVETGTLVQMRHLSRTHIEARSLTPAGDIPALPGVHDLRQDGHQVELTVDGEHLNEVLQHLGTHGFDTLTCHPPTLEELMLRHYGDEPKSATDEMHEAAH
ncbi:ABC transporter ATP-binding protein [Brevibacterium luteolum]|uniref:ABC transporter ATP-binding protein n=1 Tax=Brevibacterium luteolum TaxID=199591 RepID=UPI00223BE614|nr:ABC transporter ATP-binding protein [Brevibacterium luteolum]MCT1657240.1 ABC transporter ATP-binding protein [Brevibacterium luteolum]MCT1873289.1 ABC transporter ATP-binding protein [Brevibacterium luteolum]MCT1889906.1 ABC transporter ATP-binding protein [Brevibacterium luteolum]MCT1892308.1 ABC transporter ATP-binding protein [Brevibacterium luteolum]MCT1923615.1 ABC transporter ATP-binding protein [Brevibacterium luteolum]